MMAALLLLWAGLASAATVYVNGVRAEGLKDFEFKDVTVRIDSKGDVWVDAPRYKVQVSGEAPDPVSTAPVPAGTYWLVTEDHESTGQVVDVSVNGQVVRTVRSGEPTIVDLGPHLRRGANTVRFTPIPTSLGGGGIFKVHVGTGTHQAGTVTLSALAYTLARRPADAVAGAAEEFTLTIP